MIGFLDALVRGLGNLVRSLHPRNLRKAARDVPLYAPLAARSLRRRPVRYLLIGLSLGAGIIVFLGLAASFRGTAVSLASRTGELALPADVLVFGVRPEQGRSVESLKWVAEVGAYESFDWWEAETSIGTRRVLGVATGGRLGEALGVGPDPGPGEVFLPGAVAGAAGIAVGDTVEIGRTVSGGWKGRGFRVAGFTVPQSGEGGGGAAGRPGDPAGRGGLFEQAIIMPLPDLLALRVELADATVGVPPAAAAPGSVAVWERDPGDLTRLLGRVRRLFPKTDVWWSGMPADQAFQAAGAFLAPGNLVLGLVYVMAGLGVFDVMLLSLLERKVQLGVLKALGAVDGEVFLLLVLEGSLTAAGGTLLGLAGGAGLVRLLDRTSPVPLSLSAWSVVWAVGLAAASFYLAAWLPATLCRRASPVQLMAGRRLYLNPRSTCAQCGRCGGF